MVSIHAPARGATEQQAQLWLFNRFQSTRPRGARRKKPVAHFSVRAVSIHAPARGATVRARCAAGCHWVSIHAPARGATRHLGKR